MRKIFFVVGNMHRGGAQRVISILASEYIKRGWKVSIVMLLSDVCGYEIDSQIELVYLKGKSDKYVKNTLFWIRSLRKYLKTNSPDIVVSFVARINLITLLASRFMKQRVVISERNDPAQDNRGRVADALCKMLYKSADKIVFQTNYQKTFFENVKLRSCAIIGNPIALAEYTGEHKGQDLISVGKLLPQKHHDLLLRAYAKIQNEFPDTRVVIYGDGRLRAELETLAHELNIDENVLLPGNVGNIHDIMRCEKYFIVCSKYEGMSNALLEAMRSGMVCITSRWNGVEDIIEDGVNGILFDMDNADGLADILKRALKGEVDCECLAENARRTARKYVTEQIMDKWYAAIEGI